MYLFYVVDLRKFSKRSQFNFQSVHNIICNQSSNGLRVGIQINWIFNIDIDIAIFEKSILIMILILLVQYIGNILPPILILIVGLTTRSMSLLLWIFKSDQESQDEYME